MPPTLDELANQVADLSAQMAIHTQLSRRILEGRLDGPLPNAAADLVALEGGTTTVDVQLGKSSG
jgi:hypothetical protein